MGQVVKLKRTWNLAPILQIFQDYLELLPLLIPINWPSLLTSWVVIQKIHSKICLVSCTNTRSDVTDLVKHEMAENTKTWISWEQNILFIRNKKILNLCLRWYILRSYFFAAEVTFIVKKTNWVEQAKNSPSALYLAQTSLV